MLYMALRHYILSLYGVSNLHMVWQSEPTEKETYSRVIIIWIEFI